jgi:hypothetical protein
MRGEQTNDAKQRQAAGGRKVVSFPSKPASKSTPLPLPNQGMEPTGVADPKGIRE